MVAGACDDLAELAGYAILHASLFRDTAKNAGELEALGLADSAGREIVALPPGLEHDSDML